MGIVRQVVLDGLPQLFRMRISRGIEVVDVEVYMVEIVPVVMTIQLVI